MKRSSLKKIVTNNVSLSIIALGALCNYFLILFIRKDFPALYQSLPIYLTFLGIVSSYGLLGFDQVFLRLSKIGPHQIRISKKVFWLLMGLTLLFPLGLAAYFTRYNALSFIELYISGIAVNAVILGYNANRLAKNFSVAQLFKRSYKIVFLAGALFLLFALQREINITELLRTFTLILAGCGLLSFISFQKLIAIDSASDSGVFYLAVSFALNIGLITLLGYGERILIANEINEATFNTYFYYLIIFMFPLTMLQEYVGFKELVFFKEKIDRKRVFSKIYQLIGLGMIIYLIIIAIVWIDGGRFLKVDLTGDYKLIIIIAVLGLTKLVYGLFSAMLGAKGESRKINRINIFTAVLIALFLILMQVWGYSLYSIIAGLIVLFIYRSIHIFVLYVK